MMATDNSISTTRECFGIRVSPIPTSTYMWGAVVPQRQCLDGGQLVPPQVRGSPLRRRRWLEDVRRHAGGGMSRLTVGSLFSGIGSLSLGLERAGMRLIWVAEIEPYASAVLKKHHPDLPNHGDICGIDPARIEHPDVLCGGFPCQDISLAGKGAGLAGARSGLWFEYLRLIKAIQPKYAVIENVSALRSRGLDVVLGSLAEIGYDAEWHCIPAAAVGAPHRRDRVWIVAYPNGEAGRSEARHADAGTSGEEIRTGTSELGRCGEAVADADGERLQERSERDGETQPRFETSLRHHLGRCRPYVADTSSKGLEVGELLAGVSGQAQLAQQGQDVAVDGAAGGNEEWDESYWAVEPGICRVVDGAASRVDRLRCLGNTVVPQVAEIVGRAVVADFDLRRALEAA